MKPEELKPADMIQHKDAPEDEWWLVEYSCPEYAVVKFVKRVSAAELENWKRVHSYGRTTTK